VVASADGRLRCFVDGVGILLLLACSCSGAGIMLPLPRHGVGKTALDAFALMHGRIVLIEAEAGFGRSVPLLRFAVT